MRIAYDLPTYEALHDVSWVREGAEHEAAPAAPDAAAAAAAGSIPSLARNGNRSRVDWPEDIPWPPHGPSRVYCCGLEGSGRDADVGCIREEIKLPQRHRLRILDPKAALPSDRDRIVDPGAPPPPPPAAAPAPPVPAAA